MSSQIEGIYNALVAMSITVDTKTPSVYGLTGLPNQVASADLPCRLILALGANAVAGSSTDFYTLGGHQNVVWTMSDLLLWLPAAQGQGVKQVAGALVRYAGKYVDAVKGKWFMVSGADVEDCKVEPGMYEYPVGSGNFYYGCLSRLTIRELVE